MAAREVASGVVQIDCMRLPNAINAFVLADVVVDAGGRGHAKRILRALEGRTIRAHALTHAHPDHQGSSHALCSALDIPYWVPEGDVAAAERPELMRERQPARPLARIMDRLFTGPGHPVERPLREGDEVGGFEVIDSPGHSVGHVAYWRAEDRVLVLGDVLNNQHPLTGVPGLRLPLDSFTPDPAANARSAKRLGALEPDLVLFGHGAPLRDTARFVAFCDAI